jgi:glycerol-3-phosphate dehydrogenase subunit C
MLKQEGREVLGLDGAGDADVAAVGAATYDICELLLGLHDEGRLDTAFQPLELTVVYHAPCQQRGHGIGRPAVELLALIPGLRVVDLDIDCCGMAGTYGLKREKYGIAMQVGERLFSGIKAVAPDVVACDSETCRWQITHGSGVPTVHPVELLHRAYGLG